MFGLTAEGERSYAGRLLLLLSPDMLVLWDKGSDGNDFLTAVTANDAYALGRFHSNRRTPILSCLFDGSYLSLSGGHADGSLPTAAGITRRRGTVNRSV